MDSDISRGFVMPPSSLATVSDGKKTSFELAPKNGPTFLGSPQKGIFLIDLTEKNSYFLH